MYDKSELTFRSPFSFCLYLTLLLACLAMLWPSVSQSAAKEIATVIDIEGAIGPATTDYLQKGLAKANQLNAQFVVLRMDTPGGLDKSMRDIVKSILASPIPVVTWVGPNGARAASAGTYILYASHIAAMAPATNIGAATPVTMSAPGVSPDSDKEQPETTGNDSMQKKMVNDAVAYIEGLAELRGRNKEWAAEAVTSAASLSASEALEKNVINFMAVDLDELLASLHGLSVSMEHGTITLDTKNTRLMFHEPDWRNRFLAIITDPSIAYILLLIGIYGLVLEFYSPGTVGPGVIGAICLLIAMYALQMLPINYAGAALIILGLMLMIAEAMLPSFGILGFGGIVSFVIGSIILMDTDVPAFQIAKPIIFAFATISAALLIIALNMLRRIRNKASVAGIETLIGQHASVEAIHDSSAKIRLSGELWYVKCDEPLEMNDEVEVVQAKSTVLEVKKISSK